MSDDILSEEDRALFRKAVNDIRPVPENRKSATNPIPAIYLSDYCTETLGPEATLSFHHSGISEKRLRELKQGQIARQARLDMHGLKPEAAKEVLLHFLTLELTSEPPCILIVHGKGKAVLKNLINSWLKQIPQVLAFHSALPKDGGTGAVYVLLKRKKN